MQGSLPNILQYTSFIKRHFYNWEGLIVCLALSLSTNVFHPLVNLVVAILIIAIWLQIRRVPKFRKRQIGVLFGPIYQDEIATEIFDLKEKLQQLVREKDFHKTISIKRLPPNQTTGCHSDNVKLLAKANATLLICGNFEKFTVKGKEITGFTSLTISIIRLPFRPDSAPTLLSDAIAGKRLGWDVENTINKNMVAQNLSELARYIIGLSLIADSRFGDAQAILGPLLIDVKLKFRQKRLTVGIRRFVRTISISYVLSIVQDVDQEYSNELANERIFQLQPSVIVKWEKAIKEALKVNEQDYGALLLLAIFKFLSHDIDGSKDAIRKARTSIPLHNQSSCDISDAFLLTFEGNLRDARKLYRKIINNKHIPALRVMSNIFSFLGQAVAAYPAKPQIQFAYALLNDEFGDRTLARKEFDEFISKVNNSNNGGLTKWAREAKLRIQRIRQDVPNSSTKVE